MLETLTLGARPKGRTALAARWIVAHAGGTRRLLEHGEVARRFDLGEVLISAGFIDLDALSDLDTTMPGVDCGPAWAKGRVWPQSYVDAGPQGIYMPEELAFQKRFILRNSCATASPRPCPSRRCSTAPWGGNHRRIRRGGRGGRGTGPAGLAWPGLPVGRHGLHRPRRAGTPVRRGARLVQGFDMATASARAQARFDGLVARYPDRTWAHPPVAQIFPPAYPPL